MTAEKLATTYNNFYEFGTDKSIWRDAQKLEVRPWTIKVSGMVEKPFEIGIDDLLAKMQLEERVYRHRCVETWSMIVPWSGFPMRSLVELCKPTERRQVRGDEDAQQARGDARAARPRSIPGPTPRAWRWTRR